MDGISVIICCYNSAKRLPNTLQHLINQKVSKKINWEIIVINNNSTDNTVAIANSFWNEKALDNISFRVLNEEAQGLNNARLKGISVALYEYILFCDDDNWLYPNYLQIAYTILNENSRIGALGGVSEPVSDNELPVWFTTYQYAYAVGVQGLESGDASKRGYLWGAGMVFRKSLFINLYKSGFKFQVSDRSGSSLDCGGDSELCRWFLIAGYQLWYDERLKFKHFIPLGRLNKEYIEKISIGIDISSKKLVYYDAFLRYDMSRKSLKNILEVITHFFKYLIKHGSYSKACACSIIPYPFINKFDTFYSSIRESSEKYRKYYGSH